MPIDSNLESPRLRQAILNTLMYGDIFDYPLTAGEIQRYLSEIRATPQAVWGELDDLTGQGVIGGAGEFYFLKGREGIVPKRFRRQKISEQLWPEATDYGRLIARLPFVRMVAVTGSLAMNNMEDEGDIDYLIVTAPRQLWLCRLMVLGVVRLASWRGIRLCPNYLVSERVLEIPDHNLYTAHEFAQMAPLFGLDVYQRMQAANPWVMDFLPNVDWLKSTAQIAAGPEPAAGLRPLLEGILMTAPGIWLGKWEMDRKIKKLSRENAGNPEAVFTADLCKGHSRRHGQRIQASLNDRLQRLLLEA